LGSFCSPSASVPTFDLVMANLRDAKIFVGDGSI
jgi:hypothetical protein